MIRPTTSLDDHIPSAPVAPATSPASRLENTCRPAETALAVKYGIRRPNKAHTATAHRISKALDTAFNEGNGFDIETDEIVVEVETTATMLESASRLIREGRACYIAMTNKDGVQEALRLLDTRVGIMDPHGKIVREPDSAVLGIDH